MTEFVWMNGSEQVRKDLIDTSHEQESSNTFVMYVQQLLIGAVRGDPAAYV